MLRPLQKEDIMSKTKLLLDLAGSLRNAADTLQEIVSCIESDR